MINNYVNNIIHDLFSSIFTFGILNKYSENVIGEKIANSRMIHNLEINDDSFLYNYSHEEIIKEIFNLEKTPTLTNNNLVLSEWLSYIYVEIFFQYKKCFNYIFLYLPVSKAIDMFAVYHEMDISQTFMYFENEVNKTKLLPLLLKRKNITTKQLSVISGININTLNGYAKNDDILFSASHRNIMLLAQILGVSSNLFLEHLYISPSNGTFMSEKEKEQYMKDSVHYSYTTEMFSEIDFIMEPCDSYEEVMKALNEYINLLEKNKVALKCEKLVKIPTENKKIILVTDNSVQKGDKRSSKTIPPYVKEFSLIKVDERPYGPKYKL